MELTLASFEEEWRPGTSETHFAAPPMPSSELKAFAVAADIALETPYAGKGCQPFDYPGY